MKMILFPKVHEHFPHYTCFECKHLILSLSTKLLFNATSFYMQGNCIFFKTAKTAYGGEVVKNEYTSCDWWFQFYIKHVLYSLIVRKNIILLSLHKPVSRTTNSRCKRLFCAALKGVALSMHHVIAQFAYTILIHASMPFY